MCIKYLLPYSSKNLLIDSHIHVGQFEDNYFSPSCVSRYMADIGVDFYAVSSTSMCEEDYEKVLHEMEELIHIDGEKVLPVMWITPYGLKGNIAWFLESSIQWRCLKIHPYLHPNEWQNDGSLMEEVVEIATELNVPILIHTGNEASCVSSKFKSIISSHSNVNFILAHGRPTDEAVKLIKQYNNAYVDSAFMSIKEIGTFIKEGTADKMLWGTDMLIPKHFYPLMDMIKYYQMKLDTFKQMCSKEQFEKVTYKNAMSLFNLNENSYFETLN